MLWAMFCNIMVLPALGGETMRPRWPMPGDLFAVAGMRLEDGEDHILFARTCHAFEAHGFGQFDDGFGRPAFQFSEVHRISVSAFGYCCARREPGEDGIDSRGDIRCW